MAFTQGSDMPAMVVLSQGDYSLPTLLTGAKHRISLNESISKPYCPGELLKSCAAWPGIAAKSVPDDASDCSNTDLPSSAICPSDHVASQTSSDAGDWHQEPSLLQYDVPALPSVGSAGHSRGLCSPCGFVHHAGGCQAGADCKHCHLCPPGTIELRRKTRRKLMRSLQKGQRTKCEAAPLLYITPR